ncbi:MAG: hypothetical protein ACK5US_00905 [Lysobacteraceae bacterium]
MALSLAFVWLALRELCSPWDRHHPQPVHPPYLLLVCALAVGFAWPPVSTWRFERFLESKGRVLAEGRPVSVHCNTLLDTMLDPNALAAGHANLATGRIVLQKPWCSTLRDYLDDPAAADERRIQSLNLFTHEVMHVRGLLDERVTECHAVQYNRRMAELLGVPAPLALDHAQRYYRESYARRAEVGGLAGSYHSPECAPGRALDLRLPDSIWR